MVIHDCCRCSVPFRALLLAGGLWLVLFSQRPPVRAGAAGEDQQAAASLQAIEQASHSSSPDEQAKRQALSFAFVMLAGIIVGGALLLILVVFWGNRTRRMAQSPLPPVSKRDELWYLKSKKDSPDDGMGDTASGSDPAPDP